MCSALNKNRWFLFEKVKNYQYFATDTFSGKKCDFFGRFWPKNLNGWPDNFETFHTEKSVVLEKHLENENFILAAIHAQIGFQKSD